MSGKLTTHVLDTARGCPAAGLKIELWAIAPGSNERRLIKSVYTNSDGRTDAPLLVDEAFQAQVYELVFYAGDYFAVQSKDLPEIRFIDQVPIRFGIANSDAHYHVPLLVSPWSYSTYRGS
jgi:5-hydroxyisourate hydrolase